jgi:hypothetical protein
VTIVLKKKQSKEPKSFARCYADAKSNAGIGKTIAQESKTKRDGCLDAFFMGSFHAM